MGAPPPEAKAMVEAPKTAGEEPKIEKPTDGTAISLSAGGQLATGNSRLAAATANGIFERRFGDNGIGAGLLGNYGRSAAPGKPLATTAQNVQGRVRYDRYVVEEASVFLLNTGRHDRFQGIDFRYNLDPGFKYLFMHEQASSLWGEAGYDLQYDVRRDSARAVLDAMGMPVLVGGQPQLVPKTASDHSARVFAGFKHAFNSEVTLSTGLEYLQSFVHGSHSRVNYDAVFAAKVGGGLALGLGFSARYDHAPLAGKKKLDTATTISLIYAYSSAAETAEAPPAPPLCPEPAPPPPPPSAEPAAPPPAPMPAATPDEGAAPSEQPGAQATPPGGDSPAATGAPAPSPNAP